MPIFGVGKSLSDIEPHRYESWGSISGSGLSGSVENSLSRTQRCFQIEHAGETNTNQNFYSGTRNITPGPGTYQVKHCDPQVAPYSPEFSFGVSNKERFLSESNRLWVPSDLTTPPPGTYNLNKPSKEEYLKNLLGVSKWKLKNDQRKLKNLLKPTNFEKKTLLDEIILLEKRIKAINEELSGLPPPIKSPKKNLNPFVLTEKKAHQKTVVMQESPTFYMNEEKEWDFGSYNRGLNVHDMNSFGYSKTYVENKELEDTTQTEYVTGSASPKAHCRETDFFGPNQAHRSTTPSVGAYTPELVPTNYLYGLNGTIKSGEEDFSNCKSLSTHSSWTNKSGSYSFNFSRSLKKSASTLPDHVSPLKLRVMKAAHADDSLLSKSSLRRGAGPRKQSTFSELTLDVSLPSPQKPRAHTSEGSRSIFSPIQKKTDLNRLINHS